MCHHLSNTVVKLSTKYKTIGHRPLYKILRNKYIRRKFSPTDSTFVFSSNFQFCTLDWQGKVLIRSILIKKDQWWLRTMFEAALKPPVIINRITTFSSSNFWPFVPRVGSILICMCIRGQGRWFLSIQVDLSRSKTIQVDKSRQKSLKSIKVAKVDKSR